MSREVNVPTTATCGMKAPGRLEIAGLGIGCNAFGNVVDARRAKSIVAAALANGISLFDTANVYGRPCGASEELLGEALGKARSRAFVATKFGFPMHPTAGMPRGHGSARYINQAVDQSLKRIGTDYIDLLQIHVPDPATPIEETLDAFQSLIDRGMIRYAGLSRYSSRQLARIGRESPLSSLQVEYSLLSYEVERETLTCARQLGLSVIAFLPLGSGLLTGKYWENRPRSADSRLAPAGFDGWFEALPWEKINAIREFAVQRSQSVTAVALGYLLSQPTVASVLTGVTSAEQVLANLEASAWRPDRADLAELRHLVKRWPSVSARPPWEATDER